MALMARDTVQGMALAVIEDGQIVHVAAHGWRNAERKLPLDTATIMYGASLTKAAVGYLVLQLVDEGTLDLDASIATLLPKPLPEYEDYRDLAGDERWRALTPRILLNHASGFANFRWLEPDQTLRFHFAPGSRYAYSGEGFYILQLVLEEGLGLDVGRAMQERLFDRFDMPRTAMQWRLDFADNLADGHALDGTLEPHDERSRVSAAGSMDTDIADQARFWASVVMSLVLLVWAGFVALMAGMFTAHAVFDVNYHTFVDFRMVSIGDLVTGVAKCLAYGAAIPIVSAYRGFNAFGGAEGVGRATTDAVVHSTLAIILLNFFLSGVGYFVFPE